MALQNITGMKIIFSEYATKEDGYEEKDAMVKRGGFWERWHGFMLPRYLLSLSQVQF